jgi:carbon monoxide dehydrogenase subunit G
MVRFWCESPTDTGDVGWHGEVESVQTGQTWHFSCWRDGLRFIQAQLEVEASQRGVQQMATIERSILINAAPEAVTAVSENPGRLPEWVTGVEKVETDGGWPAVGTLARMSMRSPGLAFLLTCTSLEYVPGEKLVCAMEGLTTGTFSWSYAPDDGGTAVSYKLEYALSAGADGQVMDRLIAERANEISIEQSLNNLKALVEGV